MIIKTSLHSIGLNNNTKGLIKMQGQEVTYKEVRTFNFSNMTVRVHIPDLTTDERNRRMKQIYKAAEELIKCTERK